jgi:hypothetical protein
VVQRLVLVQVAGLDLALTLRAAVRVSGARGDSVATYVYILPLRILYAHASHIAGRLLYTPVKFA